MAKETDGEACRRSWWSSELFGSSRGNRLRRVDWLEKTISCDKYLRRYLANRKPNTGIFRAFCHRLNQGDRLIRSRDMAIQNARVDRVFSPGS
jgi:hypothetical protein